MKSCELCGWMGDAVEAHHIDQRGMGGIGNKADPSRHDTVLLCAGVGGNVTPASCHGAVHHCLLKLERSASGHLRYCSTRNTEEKWARGYAHALARRELRLDGMWHHAHPREFDAS